MIVFFLKLYALTVPVFLGIDLVWLGVISKGFYAKHLGYLMAPQVNWVAALLFYFLNIAGILLFAVSPALKEGSLSKAILLGGLYGLFTYATYDLTNLATIKHWPLIVTIVDLIWGIVLSAIVAGASYMIGSWLK